MITLKDLITTQLKTNVVNTKESDASQKIMSICNEKGVDSIVDFVNAPPTVKLDLSVVRKRGNIILVGLFGGALTKSTMLSIPFSLQLMIRHMCNYVL